MPCMAIAFPIRLSNARRNYNSKRPGIDAVSVVGGNFWADERPKSSSGPQPSAFSSLSFLMDVDFP